MGFEVKDKRPMLAGVLRGIIMKTIGLIGGMSWESTAIYYKIINETVKERLGGLHSAKILLYSVDFYEIEKCQSQGKWIEAAKILSDAAIRLENAGADFLVICTNTMHKVYSEIKSAVSIPILHIADAAADRLKEKNIKQAILLGTKYTMKQDFYKGRLSKSGISVLVPDDGDIDIINGVIYNELCLGRVWEKSKAGYLKIIDKLKKQGGEAVILGCTEIGMLIGDDDLDIPVFDTAKIHAEKAAELAIS